MSRGRRHPGAWLLVALLAVAGCQRKPTPDADTVRAVAERGPLRVTVEAWPKQVWLGDPVLLAVHVHAPDEYRVQLPGAADLAGLAAHVLDEADARPAAQGGLDWRRSFRVESEASGPLEIPPLEVKYARRTASAATQPSFDHGLVTEALRVEVRSALTTQDSVMRPRDITGTLVPARTFREAARTWLIAAAAAGLAAALVGLWLWWRRRPRAEPALPPEMWALQALAELARHDWIPGGRARELYYRLSEIIRTYIERKFALAAPEMTTAEFLSALARDPAALPYDPDRLRAFLEACDMVKYAAYLPLPEHAEQAVASARTFVHETAAAQWAQQRRLEAAPGEAAA